ncbi:hypothetical protein ACSFA7_26420 [Variovorax sp. LT1R20]|uniref:hypothetical protein n=1 Tax=Variovorax sp. LT1R20 TaxID=3443729 RepID=UPI003F461FC3
MKQRVPWSGHYSVTGAGMGTITASPGPLKRLQEPKEGEPHILHNLAGEQLAAIVQEQRERDAKLISPVGKLVRE